MLDTAGLEPQRRRLLASQLERRVIVRSEYQYIAVVNVTTHDNQANREAFALARIAPNAQHVDFPLMCAM